MACLWLAPAPGRNSGCSLSCFCMLTGKWNRSWLAGTFWPDSAETQALGNLRRSLSNLRQVLGEESYRIHSPTQSTLTFDLSNASCDLFEFDAAVERGDDASLLRALSLYRGPLLPGCDADWIVPEREARATAYGTALESLAQSAIRQGKHPEAVRLLRQLLHRDPYQEGAVCALMQALAAMGDRAGLLLAYRQFRLLLHDELQSEPMQQTKELYERLRAETAEGKGVKHVAEHVRPVTDAAPPVVRLHVPLPVSEMVGRDAEVVEIVSLLATARLITLAGTGGIGKTRLSLAVAARIADDTPDGVWFVDLAPLTDPAFVLQTIATALQVREEPGQSLLETVVGSVSSRRLLLLLDNCEHLLDACAQTVATLLHRCPHLQVLATSRQPLGIVGEHVRRVPSLSFPDTKILASSLTPSAILMDYPASRLFLERALESSSSFTLTPRNAPAVVQICARLDGIPLALELAATRVKVLTVEQIAARLDDAFRLLTGGDRTVLPRHQTLHALLEWSYRLLSKPEQRLLCQLSVFAGGWTLEAAEAVCEGEEEILDGLASLVDRSLVLASETEGQNRYRLLETVRQYAQQKQQLTGNALSLDPRHRDFYLALAGEAASHAEGPEQTAWLNRLDAEHDNLRAALQYCLGQADTLSEAAEGEGKKALRLAAALRMFWEMRGFLEEGRDWCARALATKGAQQPIQERADTLNVAGALSYYQGDYSAARSFYEEGLVLFRRLGYSEGVAASLSNVANVALVQGDAACAQACYAETLTIDRATGNRIGIAKTLFNKALLSITRGDPASAQPNLEESLVLFQQLGHQQGIAYVLSNLGYVALLKEEPAMAIRYLEESLPILRALGDRRGIAKSLSLLGLVAYDQGENASALDYQEQSLALERETGNKSGIAACFANIGNVRYRNQEYPAARRCYEESLLLFQEIGERGGIAGLLECLACVDACLHESERAVMVWAAAEALREEIGIPLSSEEQERHDQGLTKVRERLEDALVTTLWIKGRAISIDEAVSMALTGLQGNA